jgi:lipopolysaccharide/colanic/teichoic acid biosynthesis glycosyltransferase
MARNQPLLDVADRKRSGTAYLTAQTAAHIGAHGAFARGPLAGEPSRPGLALPSPARRQPRIGADDVLPRADFLRHLEREKRRVDRSKASLSVVVFSLDGARADPAGDTDRLLAELWQRKRETDVIGYLSDDRVAVLLPDTNAKGATVLTQKVIAQCRGLAVATVAATYPDRVFDDLKAEHRDAHDVNPLFPEGLAGTRAGSYPLKRAVDVVGALAALLLLSPLLLAIAFAVAATSRGPIIFKQVRLGKRGVPFTFYKFRSMRCGADDRVHREYVAKLINGNLEEINQGAAAKPLYKMQDDPRITRIGKLLRKTSLDELPQLFNVLKGDMSLVGPRPPLPYEAEKYQPWHLRRVLEIKPGITGLWQVNGRSRTSFDEMVRLDLRYVRTCSLGLDLKILVGTVRAVLEGEGAT